MIDVETIQKIMGPEVDEKTLKEFSQWYEFKNRSERRFKEQLIPYDARIKLEDKLKQTLKFSGDKTVTTVLKEKFLKEKIDGLMETGEDRYASVAVELASNELRYNPEANIETLATDIYKGMINQEITFNTPLLLNFARFHKNEIGTVEQYSQLGSACFVLPMDDSIKRGGDKTAIFETVACAADVQQSGGGTGFSGRRLRAKATQVKKVDKDPRHIRWDRNTGLSSGYLSFFKVLNEETHATTQGNNRRGANMGIQEIDHADFLDHMYAKLSEGEFKEFNFSMGTNEEFMLKVLQDGYFTLKNPIKGKKHIVRGDEIASQEVFEKRLNGLEDAPLPPMYKEEGTSNIINGYTGKKIGMIFEGQARIHARTILSDMGILMYHNGEPGSVFLDRMNLFNPTPLLGEIEATNPCGEQPLLPFEACNLAPINVAKFVGSGTINYEKGTSTPGKVDKERMGPSIDLLVRCLDSAIDLSDFPLPQITEAVSKTRKIGVGLTAIAEAAIKARVKLNSPQGIEFCEDIAKYLSERCRDASSQLAEERGLFPAFKGSIYDEGSDANKKLQGKPMNYNVKVRNAAMTSYAPNGTTGRLVGQKAQGIEPLFALKYKSNVLGRKNALEDVSQTVIEVLNEEGFYSDELMEAVCEGNSGSFKITDKTPETYEIELEKGNKKTIKVKSVIEEVPEVLREILVTSADLKPKDHIDIQAAFQKYCDSAVSKTVNCPNDTPVGDITDLLMYAYEKGCKGFTVYRTGSRELEVLTKSEIKAETTNGSYKRPKLQKAFVYELPVGSANPAEKRKIFSTIAYDPTTGKVNSVFQAASWGDGESLRTTVSETRAWSSLLKKSGGNPESIEALLATLPQGEYKALAEISNDTTQNAMLKSFHMLRFLSEGYKNFGAIDSNYDLLRNGKVKEIEVLKARGNFKLEKTGLPALFPDQDSLVASANYSHLTKECPACHVEEPPFGIVNGCIHYNCCDYRVCSGD